MNNSTEYPYGDYTIDVGPAAASPGGWSSLFRVARNGATVYRGQGQASPDPRQAEGLARNTGKGHVDQIEGKRVRLGPSFYELPDEDEAKLARRWLTDRPDATPDEFADRFETATLSIFIGGSQTI